MANGGFGAAGEGGAARGGGAPRREAVRYSDEVAAEICERVAMGESLSGLEQQAGFPSRTAVSYWRRTRPAFDEALGAAQLTAGRRRRAADRTAEAARLARPRKRTGGRGSTYTPEIGQEICERLADGESAIAIATDPAMPSAGTIYRWVQRHADFQDQYVVARRLQADYLFDEAREVALAATPQRVWVARLQFDVIRWMAPRLAPRKYCEPVVAAEALAEQRDERLGETGTMNVYVKRFTDAPVPALGGAVLAPGEARLLYSLDRDGRQDRSRAGEPGP